VKASHLAKGERDCCSVEETVAGITV